MSHVCCREDSVFLLVNGTVTSFCRPRWAGEQSHFDGPEAYLRPKSSIFEDIRVENPGSPNARQLLSLDMHAEDRPSFAASPSSAQGPTFATAELPENQHVEGDT